MSGLGKRLESCFPPIPPPPNFTGLNNVKSQQVSTLTITNQHRNKMSSMEMALSKTNERDKGYFKNEKVSSPLPLHEKKGHLQSNTVS